MHLAQRRLVIGGILIFLVACGVSDLGRAGRAEVTAPQVSFFGVYRGTVVNNVDPQMLMRITVQVPDVLSTQTAWASACVPVGAMAVPANGEGVWITFEQGDPAFPIWIGTRVTTPRTSGAAAPPAQPLGLRAAPNPSRGRIELVTTVTREDEATLQIFDLQGRLVRAVFAGRLSPGSHSFAWDARSDDGEPVAAGTYFGRLHLGGDERTTALVVAR